MCECNLLWKACGKLFLWLGGCPVIINRDALCELISANTDTADTGLLLITDTDGITDNSPCIIKMLRGCRCHTCLLNHTDFIVRFTLNFPLFALMIYLSNKYHALLKRANRIKVIKLPTASKTWPLSLAIHPTSVS